MAGIQTVGTIASAAKTVADMVNPADPYAAERAKMAAKGEYENRMLQREEKQRRDLLKQQLASQRAWMGATGIGGSSSAQAIADALTRKAEDDVNVMYEDLSYRRQAPPRPKSNGLDRLVTGLGRIQQVGGAIGRIL
jgi:uncharacterized protein with ATP-grasp and redox domains